VTAPGARLGPRVLIWAILCGAMATACAVSVPPSGGPEDKTPPGIAETTPARDSAGVAADSPVRITFSEDMTRRGAERNVEFSPAVEIAEARWDGRTLVIYPAGGLNPDTTYVVTLKPGLQDNHRVATRKEFRFAFATSAAIDTGRVAGRVLFRREPTANAVVYCYVPRDTAFAPGATRPERRVQGGESGLFILDYLDPRGATYLLWAYEDVDKDGRYAPDKDVGYAGIDTITLGPDHPVVSGVTLAIVDPDEPARIDGRIVNASGIDTLRVTVALYPVPPDSLADSLAVAVPNYYTLCDTTGAYLMDTVHAGDYVLRAFVDVNADSVCGTYPCGPDSAATCAEPCVTHPDTVRVAPGDERSMAPIELEAARSGKRP
jgi:hypothetical protein